jgi:hypothetical protein
LRQLNTGDAHNKQESHLLEHFFIVAIVLNSISLATEHYGESEQLKNVNRIANYVFTGIFSLEAIIKVAGYGFIKYFTTWSYLFDFVLVVSALLDLYLAKESSGLLVLRSFKVFRVTRLFRHIQKVQAILFTIIDSISEAVSLGALFLLFVFINALLGKTLFGD